MFSIHYFWAWSWLVNSSEICWKYLKIFLRNLVENISLEKFLGNSQKFCSEELFYGNFHEFPQNLLTFSQVILQNGLQEFRRNGLRETPQNGLLEFLRNWLQEFLGIGSDFFPGNNSKKISGPGQTLATLRCSTQEFLNGESFPGNLEKISNFCWHFHRIFSW